MNSLDNDFTLPPFPAFPCVTRYVGVGTVDESLERIDRAILAREAMSLVIGPPGTGKTLLGEMVRQRCSDSHRVVLMGDAPMSDGDGFRRMLAEALMGAADVDVSTQDLSIRLPQMIQSATAGRRGLVLIVDEAQTLSGEVLESIRMLTNTMDQGKPRVSAVLIGGVKLDDTLASPSMNAISQRVATRCYLHPLSADETRRYVSQVISDCGAEPTETITDEAISSLYHATSGVPRLINQMMTEAIDCAAENDQALIDANMIDRAWAKIQQLPSPMTEEPTLTKEGSDVEFGTLDSGVLADVGDVESCFTDEELDAISSESIPSARVKAQDPAPSGEEAESVCEMSVEDAPMEVDPSASYLNVEMVINTQQVPDVAVMRNVPPVEMDIADAEPEMTTAGETPLVTEESTADSSSDQDVVFREAFPPELLADVMFENRVAADNTTTPTLQLDDLFGEFDEEEEVNVGKAQTRIASTNQGSVADEATCDDSAPQVSSEIVSLADYTTNTIDVQADPVFAGGHSIGAVNDAPRPSIRVETDDPFEEVESVSIGFEPKAVKHVPETKQQESAGGKGADAKVIWYDEPAEPEPMRVSDDRDIIMVTEDIMTEVAPAVRRVDREETELAVDYQQILAKMRNIKTSEV